MPATKNSGELTTLDKKICSAYAAWVISGGDHQESIVNSLNGLSQCAGFDQALAHWQTITKSTVTTSKKEAKRLKLIRESFDVQGMDKHDPKLRKLVDHALFVDVTLDQALRTLGSNALKEVLVVPEASKFEEFCAHRLLLLMAGATTIGVMWGRMVKVAIDALSHSCIYQKLPGYIRCMPVSGEPSYMLNTEADIFESPADFSASVLAKNLANNLRFFQGKTVNRQPMPSLLGVACYVGGAKKQDSQNGWQTERESVMNNIKSYPGWQAIFGENGMAKEMDMLITGIGHVSNEGGDASKFGMFIKERSALEDLTPACMQRLCHGDLAGTLLIKKGLNSTDQKIAENLNHGWTGLKESDLRRISRKSPGVVLICEGKSKAEVVAEAVRSNLVTRLICDRPLRDALLELLQPPSKRKRHP